MYKGYYKRIEKILVVNNIWDFYIIGTCNGYFESFELSRPGG